MNSIFLLLYGSELALLHFTLLGQTAQLFYFKGLQHPVFPLPQITAMQKGKLASVQTAHLIAQCFHHTLDLAVSSLDNRQIKAALIFLWILLGVLLAALIAGAAFLILTYNTVSYTHLSGKAHCCGMRRRWI